MGSGKSKETIMQVDRKDPDYCKREWNIVKNKKLAHEHTPSLLISKY